jgi:aspartate racemase
MPDAAGPPRTPLAPKQVIGIVGGLGPFAHIDFERRLMVAARELAGAVSDQDYPEWILSSIPQTPDRTLAIQGQGRTPVPEIVRSLKRFETHRDANGQEQRGADFAVIVCVTSHRFMDELSEQTPVPIMSLVEETAREIAHLRAGARVGLLATTGTLKSGHFHSALRARGLVPLSPLDLPDGEALQRRLVMEAIYGPWLNGRHTGGGIKSTGGRPDDRRALSEAATRLAQAGAEVLIAGCTEIGLVMPGPEAAGLPIFDPMHITACACIRRVYGLSAEGDHGS